MKLSEFVRAAPGLAMPAVTTVEQTVNGYEVEVEVVVEAGRLVAQEVRVRRTPNGPPVTSEAIRAVPVAALTKSAAAHVVEMEEQQDGVVLSPRGHLYPKYAARLRENGPTSETLEWVTYLYRVGLLMGEPPTKLVGTAIGIPRSTAGRWVAAARKQGLLGPSEGSGKAGG